MENGQNEDIELDIPKRRGYKIRYLSLVRNGEKVLFTYCYFDDKHLEFGEVFLRIYEKADNGYKLICEKSIGNGVRGIMCRYDETMNECVYLFDKVSVEDNRIRVTGEYLATFDWEQGRFQKIFDISNSTDNGVRAYAVSSEEDIVAIAWATRVSAYHMKSGELIYEFLAKEDKLCEINDVCLVDGTLLIACNDGLWEISL